LHDFSLDICQRSFDNAVKRRRIVSSKLLTKPQTRTEEGEPVSNVERYLRDEVIRMLHISPRQLAGWERAGLIAVAESYSFYDLLQIKKLSELRAKKVRPAKIRASIDAMQRQVSGMQNPLLEAGVFSYGSRLTFRHDGREL